MSKDWNRESLESLCDIALGRTPSRADKSMWDTTLTTENVWLSIADMPNDELGGTVFDSKERISDLAARQSRIVSAGTLLCSFKLTLGRLAFAGRDLYTNEAIAALPLRTDRVLPRFLFYYLSYFDWDAACEGDIKLKGKTLNKAKLKRILVSYPDLREQERLVAILDEAFNGIAEAAAMARQSLLLSRAVYQSELNNEFRQLSETWGMTPLGSLCEFENGDRGTNYPSKSARTATGIPFINAGHLTERGLDLDHMDYISRERYDRLGAGKIRPNDILFCLRGSLGKCASVGDLAEGAIASSLVIVRPQAPLSHDYLLAFLRTEMCAGMIRRFAGGAAQPNLSGASLKLFDLPVPSPEVQKGIVRDLRVLGDASACLETTYESKAAALSELKKSLLHEAFSGNL